MHLVKLMQRKTGKQCLLRRAQQIKLEGMNILTGAKDHGLPHETRKGPEAELHPGLVVKMPTKTEVNPKGRTHVTTDIEEADLRQFILLEGIPCMHLQKRRTICTSDQNASLIAFAKSPCIPA